MAVISGQHRSCEKQAINTDKVKPVPKQADKKPKPQKMII